MEQTESIPVRTLFSGTMQVLERLSKTSSPTERAALRRAMALAPDARVRAERAAQQLSLRFPGSTQAGMVVGFAADGRARKVIGIDASAKPEKTHAQILRIAQNTAKLVELGQEISAEDVVLDTRYGGPEYGLPNEGTLEAIRLCARQEGMLTDPVYEGKSMHGMIDRVRRGEFPEGSRVLYAHLGGVPALNAYSFLFRNG